MAKYKLGKGHVSIARLDETGNMVDKTDIGEGNVPFFVSSTDNQPETPIDPSNMPSVTVIFSEIDDRQYRGLLRSIGLDLLWNAWQRIIQRFTDRN